MKILLAVHQFFPDFRAGTETLTRRSAEELQARGHQLTILCAGPHQPHQPLLRRECWQELDLIRFNPPPEASPLAAGMAHSYRHPGLEPIFRELLSELRPDLLHLFHLRRHTLSLMDAAVAIGVPLVASLTDYWFTCPTGQLQFPEQQPCPGPRDGSANCLQHLASRLAPPLRPLPRLFWRLAMAVGTVLPGSPLAALRQRPQAMVEALGRCERVLLPSRLMWQTLVDLGFDDRRFELCPYGIDLRGLDALPARSPWGGPAERPLRVGFIGSFNRAKGAHVLLEALAQLGPAFPADVFLYGNPADDRSYAMQLQYLVQRLPQVRWSGVFASEDVFQVLQPLDLLVVPSLWRENAPLIVLQALASGLPLLLSDVEGMADQVQVGVNALLFPPGDSRALAARLASLVQRPESLAALIDRGGLPRSIGQYGDQLEGLYARLQRL
jgi:glycosyltransferase involved in cell wall biosynthesis